LVLPSKARIKFDCTLNNVFTQSTCIKTKWWGKGRMMKVSKLLMCAIFIIGCMLLSACSNGAPNAKDAQDVQSSKQETSTASTANDTIGTTDTSASHSKNGSDITTDALHYDGYGQYSGEALTQTGALAYRYSTGGTNARGSVYYTVHIVGVCTMSADSDASASIDLL
jgi:hypothetical protein